MYWILQRNLFREEGFARLVDTLERYGLPYSLHTPFHGELDCEPPIPEGEKVIVMGSYALADIARKRGWTPGAFITDDLDYRTQLGHWGALMFNADAVFCQLGEVQPQENPFFIRPARDSKMFTGQVMDWPSFQEWIKVATTDSSWGKVVLSAEVMVCAPKKIVAEYRTWVVDKKVVTSSGYKRGSRAFAWANIDPMIEWFAAGIAETWSPAPAYCLDLFQTENGLFIGEVNCINSAGFYEANIGKLVEALEDLGSR